MPDVSTLHPIYEVWWYGILSRDGAVLLRGPIFWEVVKIIKPANNILSTHAYQVIEYVILCDDLLM